MSQTSTCAKKNVSKASICEDKLNKSKSKSKTSVKCNNKNTSKTSVSSKPKSKSKKKRSKCKEISQSSINPDLYLSSPRPGGFLKIVVPTKSQDFIASGGPSPSPAAVTSETDTESNITESLFVKKSHMDNTSSVNLKGQMSTPIGETDWEDDDFLDITDSDPCNCRNASSMLAITISTVMLMAADKEDIPEEYLNWTENYLSGMKDDMGQNPPNIRGLLKHIAKLRVAKCKC